VAGKVENSRQGHLSLHISVKYIICARWALQLFNIELGVAICVLKRARAAAPLTCVLRTLPHGGFRAVPVYFDGLHNSQCVLNGAVY